MRRRFVSTVSLVVSRVLQRGVRYFNPAATFILSSRLHAVMSGRLALLAFTGRKTGRSYTTPASYVREGSSLRSGRWCLVAEPPQRGPVTGASAWNLAVGDS